jgi:penicillin amidase
MRHSVVRAAAACALVVAAACRREAPPPRPPLTAQTSGTVVVAGLRAPVRVTRDRWGVPHIYASSRDDLFIAQGFVQAQDRLFQMDLWRRSVQGRLSAVLGPNFIERDAMTRRMQYRGDLAAEWASYGPDARAAAIAFVQGVNAWVTLARARPPEPFVLAGWRPDFWEATDLLNRTEAFLASGNAIQEIGERRLSPVIADAIRRVGTPPFFTTLAAPVAGGATNAGDRELVSPLALQPVSTSGVAIQGGAVVVAEAGRTYDHPSPRYVVHLVAPDLNVVGVTAPWRPGVAIGHNEHLAWGAAPVGADTQDIDIEPIDPSSRHIVQDAIVVKGRREPFAYETELTAHGVVVASDRVHGRNFALRWTGYEPGAAAEMSSLTMDVAETPDQFHAAAAGWRMPARRFVVLGRDGREGQEREQTRARAAKAPSSSTERRRAVFAHVLGVTEAARWRFNIGPLDRPERDDQPVRAVLDARAWDASRAMNAPGQSESPDSPHFSDLARLWSKGEMFPLVFSDEAVQDNAEATLTLLPRR